MRWTGLTSAGLAMLGLALAGCQGAQTSSDPYAGLSTAILAWHSNISMTPSCGARTADGGKACQSFVVGCKVEEPIVAGDVGVTAKVLAGMSWDVWNPVSAAYEPSSGGAVFAKTNGQWVRRDLNRPINLGTCATS